ncbi:MAG: 2-oxoglutarate oxidoreductase [Anaerolineales bacterium]|nr:2-oxoglutarate oxidoreductase [Anaerolineales bacterium]
MSVGYVDDLVYAPPASLNRAHTHYCPGCGHGVAQRLVAEVIDELGLAGQTVGVAPVGCSVFLYNYFELDFVVAPHGRAPAMATGLKRVLPERIIFTYQGDGDLASIGLAEIMHAAVRGEKITVVFLNNAVYGMTGGQMAPTSLPGQKTTSSPYGRDPALTGAPLRMAELLAQVDGAAYVARRSLHNPREILRAKKAIRRAFETQRAGLGLAVVELLSNCPTNWGCTPAESLNWIERHMLPYFPLGDFKVTPEVAALP